MTVRMTVRLPSGSGDDAGLELVAAGVTLRMTVRMTPSEHGAFAGSGEDLPRTR